MKKQNKAQVLFRMLKLVKPLSGFMILAVTLGTLGFLTAEFIPILGGEAILIGLGIQTKLTWNMLVGLLLSFAVLRAIFRFSEQRTNHYIAFTLLAIIRDRVFKALRRLCPAKLEGRDKGDLISLITSDVELLEVFYAHTISPICIAIASENGHVPVYRELPSNARNHSPYFVSSRGGGASGYCFKTERDYGR